jgi:triacylglycerol lipase
VDRQRARAAVARGARALCSPTGVRGTAIEATWVAAHLVTYPFGIAQEKARPQPERFSLQGLPLVQRSLLYGDVTAAGTPILLVHGLVDNRSIFTLLCRSLRRRGFGRVSTYNYRPWTTDLRAAAARLGEQVEAICEQTGYERIHVVGHSMGGILARYYVQRLGGDARVHTLVTLGSPHGGTGAARLLPFGVTAQLTPTSAVIEELRSPAAGCRTRFVAFWSDLDGLISPKRAARIDHPDLSVRNVFVRGAGHMSLPIDRRVVHDIVTTLAHLEADGSTATAGVTPIGAASDRGAREPALVTRSPQPGPSTCTFAAADRPAAVTSEL